MSDLFPIPPGLDPDEIARVQRESNEVRYRLERTNRTGLPYAAPILCDTCGQSMPFHESGCCEVCRFQFVERWLDGNAVAFDVAAANTPPSSYVRPIPLDEIFRTPITIQPPGDVIPGMDHHQAPWWNSIGYPVSLRLVEGFAIPLRRSYRIRRITILFALGILSQPAYRTL